MVLSLVLVPLLVIFGGSIVIMHPGVGPHVGLQVNKYAVGSINNRLHRMTRILVVKIGRCLVGLQMCTSSRPN